MDDNERNHRRREWWLALITAVLAALFSVYQGYLTRKTVGIAADQLRFAKDQALESSRDTAAALAIASRNANAAEQSVNNQITEMQLRARPWLGADEARLKYSVSTSASSANEEIQFVYTLRVAAGGTPALNVHTAHSCSATPIKEHQPMKRNAEQRGTAAMLPNITRDFICKNIFINIGGTPKFTDGGSFILRGSITYDDIFSQTHRSGFCYEMRFAGAAPMSDQQMNPCPKGNFVH